MNAKSWIIVGGLAVLLLAATGGYLYEKLRDHTEPDDPAYVTMLVADYDELIGRVTRSEEIVDGLNQGIADLEGTVTEIAGELEDSRGEVAFLIAERERRRRLNEEARRAIAEGYETSLGIGDASDRAIAGLWEALDLLGGTEGGDLAPEG